MKLPTDKDIAWLEECLNDPKIAIGVVVEGYVHEYTDFLRGLVETHKELKIERELSARLIRGLHKIARDPMSADQMSNLAYAILQGKEP